MCNRSGCVGCGADECTGKAVVGGSPICLVEGTFYQTTTPAKSDRFIVFGKQPTADTLRAKAMDVNPDGPYIAIYVKPSKYFEYLAWTEVCG